ncbi:SEC3 family protein [Abortiporus biennis]
MADNDSIRQRIISSALARRKVEGSAETYVAHIKIWEDAGPDDGGGKARYIILTQTDYGTGFIHKSKLNANGSFSVGKSWKLQDLKGVELLSPMQFSVILSRTNKWQTENETDQYNFIVSLIRTFRDITNNSVPLNIMGMKDPDAGRAPPQIVPPQPPTFVRLERAPTPTNGVPIQPTSRRPQQNGHADSNSRTSNFSARSSSPTPVVPHAPRTPSRNKRAPSPAPPRAESPDMSSRSHTPADRAMTPTRNRPTTPSAHPQQSSNLRPKQGRRPSNASSTGGARASATSNTSSQIPSVVIPSSPSRPNAPSPSVTDNHRVNGTYPTTLDIPTNLNASSSMQPSPLSAYQQTPDTPKPRPISPNHSSNLSGEPLYGNIQESPTQLVESPTTSPSGRGKNRVSFYDPLNQNTLDMLLQEDNLPLDHAGLNGEEDGIDGKESTPKGEVLEMESAQATLTSVEEMLEGYEWSAGDILDGKAGKGTADQIEARLLDELTALDKANIHSFIESDDRVNIVLQYLDDALAELESLDSIVASYKIHLNAVNEDIAFIQSQDRGLQVQTQNQRALLREIEDLLKTVQVDRESLITLTQESLEKAASINKLEEAAAQLYKALLASRDRDMAATMERLSEYRTHNAQFCKRIYDFLAIMFTAQSKLLLGDSNGVVRSSRKGKLSLKEHRDFETYLGRYGGLILYLKEMDEPIYGKVCSAYFSAANQLHGTQFKAYLAALGKQIKPTASDEDDGFGVTTPTNQTYRVAAVGMRRAGTIVRSPLEGRKEKKDKDGDGELRPTDALGLILEQITPMVYREEDFIADFLQINDTALTFADYMSLENYFRRQAARTAGVTAATMKLVRGAMDFIFSFLPGELKSWLESHVEKDTFELVGVIGGLERFLTEAEERGNTFFYNILEKQHGRLRSLFDRRMNENVKMIEDVKLTSRRRNGVAPFIKYFPTYIGRIENQLIGADTLEIRHHVDQAYNRIVQAMFEVLKQMANMNEDNDDDKGQLNYHVIMIENMHHFSSEVAQLSIGSVAKFLEKANNVYEENLNSYCKIVLRRPFAKIIDFFEGIERLLKTTAPTEIPNNANYSKTAAKKLLKDYNAKELRKLVDTLFRRVEKHFTDTSQMDEFTITTTVTTSSVIGGVWKACEDELLRITELFNKRINQCYQGQGVTLEYTPSDVEAAFKRHKGS